MKSLPIIFALCLALAAILNCQSNRNTTLPASAATTATDSSTPANPQPRAAKTHSGKVIHLLVALCDNVNQGIVPVPARLGNGEDLQNNLYWGAAFGVKAFFKNQSSSWKLISSTLNPNEVILERCVFKHKTREVYLIADAYRGSEIKQCIVDFFNYAAGDKRDTTVYQDTAINVGGNADLIAYVGHDGLMDFNLESFPKKQNDKRRDALMLCCISKNYFAAPLRASGANPLLWTTGLMAPESYILRSAIDGWLAEESGEQIRERAAQAYNQYQRCGLKAARNLFATGW
ncbi:MAG: hypothetical protein AB1757_17750 [Acidobacteriota bacterium]